MSHVLVLGDPSGLEPLRRALAEGCAIVDRSPRSHDELAGLGHRSDDGTMIWVLEDHVGEIAYVTVEGPTAALWAAKVRRSTPCVSLGSVLAELATSPTPLGWIRGLSRLAVLRDDVEAATSAAAMIRLWTTALAHRERIVRRAAIRTAHGARWPALAAVVAQRLASDPELAAPLQQLAAHLAQPQPDA